jgi:hypothetical protein
MHNILYEILNEVDNISFYNLKLYLLNKEVLKYAEHRKVADKASIMNLPDAIFDVVVDNDCKLRLNWLHFLFGADIYRLSFASINMSRDGTIMISDLNETKSYCYGTIEAHILKNTSFYMEIYVDLKYDLLVYLKRQS